MKVYNSKWATISYKVDGKMRVAENRVLVPMGSIVGDRIMICYDRNCPTLFPVQFTDYKSIYPTVVSIELTDKCNFRCKHCYGSFKPENEHEIPNEMLQPLFTSLKEIGVLTVELTGGDVSVYPHTATAIETAINCGIQSVMIHIQCNQNSNKKGIRL